MTDQGIRGRESIPGGPIAVLGAGSWGTALALFIARNGRDVLLWGRSRAHREAMREQRGNDRYLPGQPFPANIEIVDAIPTAVERAAAVLVAVPSHAFREIVEGIATSRPAPLDLFWATKGFDPGGGALLGDVAAGALVSGSRLAVLSGPTFAGEVAAGLPTAVTLASEDLGFAAGLADLLGAKTLRVYTSGDPTGVQIGGAVKNVLAVAAGIADGLGFGANTRAALIARGLAEMMRLGEALGGQRETFMGLAGLGDLVLTCTDDQSRNRRFGLCLARGDSVADAQRTVGQVVEGAGTARLVVHRAREIGVAMPICEQVLQVVEGGVAPHAAVDALLSREVGTEAL